MQASLDGVDSLRLKHTQSPETRNEDHHPTKCSHPSKTSLRRGDRLGPEGDRADHVFSPSRRHMHMPEALTLNTDAQDCAGKQQRIFDLDQSTGLSSIHPSIHPRIQESSVHARLKVSRKREPRTTAHRKRLQMLTTSRFERFDIRMDP